MFVFIKKKKVANGHLSVRGVLFDDKREMMMTMMAGLDNVGGRRRKGVKGKSVCGISLLLISRSSSS